MFLLDVRVGSGGGCLGIGYIDPNCCFFCFSFLCFLFFLFCSFHDSINFEPLLDRRNGRTRGEIWWRRYGGGKMAGGEEMI
jgi:hypothetical protein